MPTSSYLIRMATPDDASRMLEIYGPVVQTTPISFEIEPPTQKEFRQRIADTLQHLPWLACEFGGCIAGYAYATPFRSRSGYRWSVEVSVYVAEQFRRRGVASALYTALLEGLRILGYFNAYAGISLPNAASVKAHESMGFRPVGVFPSVGFKLGGWHDVGFWRLTLQPHATDPSEPKLLQHLPNNPRWKDTLKDVAAQIATSN